MEHRAGSSAITRLTQRATAPRSESLQIHLYLCLSYGAAPCQGMALRCSPIVFCHQVCRAQAPTARLQKSDEEQFFYEVPVATPVPEATQQLVAIHNLRMRIKRSAQQHCVGSNGLPARQALTSALQPTSSEHTQHQCSSVFLGSSWRAASLCSTAQPSALTSKALMSMRSSL